MNMLLVKNALFVGEERFAEIETGPLCSEF